MQCSDDFRIVTIDLRYNISTVVQVGAACWVSQVLFDKLAGKK